MQEGVCDLSENDKFGRKLHLVETALFSHPGNQRNRCASRADWHRYRIVCCISKLVDPKNQAIYKFPEQYLISDQIAPLHLILIPGIGGLITGLIIHFTTDDIKGGGIPEVIEAVRIRGGRIQPRIAIIKLFATAICIGTGGSAGSGGPIALIGASIGSSIGQLFRLSEKRIRTLVACGVGGGTAAIFNAPIAGSLFAVEVILHNISSGNFSAIVITSVVSSTIARLLKGNSFFFNVPDYPTTQPLELILFFVLGFLAAVSAIGFSRLRYFIEDMWNKTHIPDYLRTATGGVLVGLIGVFTYKYYGFPRVFGMGYETINQALTIGITLKIGPALAISKNAGNIHHSGVW